MIASYKTDDYDRFVILEGNRTVGKSHVKKIKSKMEKKNLLQYIPIVVNEDMQVIDGQHRLQAARELGVPVYYVIAPGTTLSDVQDINTATKTWDNWQFLESYCQQQNPHYLRLKSFCVENNASVAAALMILKGQRTGDDTLRFKNGKFKASESDYQIGNSVHALMSLLNKYAKTNLMPNNLFIGACRHIVLNHNIDLDRLRSKLELMKNTDEQFGLVRHTNQDYYLVDIQHIYNYRNRLRNVRFV